MANTNTPSPTPQPPDNKQETPRVPNAQQESADRPSSPDKKRESPRGPEAVQEMAEATKEGEKRVSRAEKESERLARRIDECDGTLTPAPKRQPKKAPPQGEPVVKAVPEQPVAPAQKPKRSPSPQEPVVKAVPEEPTQKPRKSPSPNEPVVKAVPETTEVQETMERVDERTIVVKSAKKTLEVGYLRKGKDQRGGQQSVPTIETIESDSSDMDLARIIHVDRTNDGYRVTIAPDFRGTIFVAGKKFEVGEPVVKAVPEEPIQKPRKSPSPNEPVVKAVPETVPAQTNAIVEAQKRAQEATDKAIKNFEVGAAFGSLQERLPFARGLLEAIQKEKSVRSTDMANDAQRTQRLETFEKAARAVIAQVEEKQKATPETSEQTDSTPEALKKLREATDKAIGSFVASGIGGPVEKQFPLAQALLKAIQEERSASGKHLPDMDRVKRIDTFEKSARAVIAQVEEKQKPQSSEEPARAPYRRATLEDVRGETVSGEEPMNVDQLDTPERQQARLEDLNKKLATFVDAVQNYDGNDNPVDGDATIYDLWKAVHEHEYFDMNPPTGAQEAYLTRRMETKSGRKYEVMRDETARNVLQFREVKDGTPETVDDYSSKLSEILGLIRDLRANLEKVDSLSPELNDAVRVINGKIGAIWKDPRFAEWMNRQERSDEIFSNTNKKYRIEIKVGPMPYLAVTEVRGTSAPSSTPQSTPSNAPDNTPPSPEEQPEDPSKTLELAKIKTDGAYNAFDKARSAFHRAQEGGKADTEATARALAQEVIDCVQAEEELHRNQEATNGEPDASRILTIYGWKSEAETFLNPPPTPEQKTTPEKEKVPEDVQTLRDATDKAHQRFVDVRKSDAERVSEMGPRTAVVVPLAPIVANDLLKTIDAERKGTPAMSAERDAQLKKHEEEAKKYLEDAFAVGGSKVPSETPPEGSGNTPPAAPGSPETPKPGAPEAPAGAPEAPKKSAESKEGAPETEYDRIRQGIMQSLDTMKDDPVKGALEILGYVMEAMKLFGDGKLFDKIQDAASKAKEGSAEKGPDTPERRKKLIDEYNKWKTEKHDGYTNTFAEFTRFKKDTLDADKKTDTENKRGAEFAERTVELSILEKMNVDLKKLGEMLKQINDALNSEGLKELKKKMPLFNALVEKISGGEPAPQEEIVKATEEVFEQIPADKRKEMISKFPEGPFKEEMMKCLTKKPQEKESAETEKQKNAALKILQAFRSGNVGRVPADQAMLALTKNRTVTGRGGNKMTLQAKSIGEATYDALLDCSTVQIDSDGLAGKGAWASFLGYFRDPVIIPGWGETLKNNPDQALNLLKNVEPERFYSNLSTSSYNALKTIVDAARK